MEVDVCSPNCRQWHVALNYRNSILLWGGSHCDDTSLSIKWPSSKLYKYDSIRIKWICMETTGDYPTSRDGCGFVIYNDRLYVFGGLCLETGNPSNDLYYLDLNTKIWTKLELYGPSPLHSNKVSWLYKNTMYSFGGYGWDDTNLVDINDNIGYNQQLSAINLDNGHTEILYNHNTPHPRSGAAVIQIENKAILFGGHDSLEWYNDLHLLDLETLKWTEICEKTIDKSYPIGRSDHTFTVLDANFACIYGGVDCADRILGDLWLLDLRLPMMTNPWKKVSLLQELGPIKCHMSVFINGELIVTGGIKRKRIYYNAVRKIPLRVGSLKNLSLNSFIRYFDEDNSIYKQLPPLLLSLVKKCT